MHKLAWFLHLYITEMIDMTLKGSLAAIAQKALTFKAAPEIKVSENQNIGI